MPRLFKKSRKVSSKKSPKSRSVRRPKSKSTKKRSMKKRGGAAKKCAKGMIRRSAYTKKSGVRVKSACVPDKGRPGKGGPIKVSLDDKHLGKYGYSLKKSSSARRKAIQKAVKAKGALTVLRRLVVLRTYRKYNKKSADYVKLDKDVKYLRNRSKIF
jgi:hypothetical protein